ncbi:MAG: MoaD/ThiS family protein [Gammaproteobacteria bacterium]|nr:MoaD/ThiS family protein [Gammaproteobacteria bacterium]
MTVSVVLPTALQSLARTGSEVELEVAPPVTQRSVLTALEKRFPMLKGAIIDHATGDRRPMIRFFACQEDLSHVPLDHPLPKSVAAGDEAFIVVGAISGG